MNVRKGVLLAILVLWLPSASFAADDREDRPKKGYLDEYNVEVFFAGEDTARLAAGVTFGDVLRNGIYWCRGARVSLLQVPSPQGERNGFALGGVLVAGHRPERWVSPVASLWVDRPFGIGGRYGLETTVGIGARLRVSPKLPEHYAISASFIRNDLFGSGSVGDRTDYGIAVFYSTSVLLRP